MKGKAGSPYTLVEGDVVWLLGDVVTHFTHFVSNCSMPCTLESAGSCPHCANGVLAEKKGWAPGLVLVATRGPQVVWQPRTLRIPKHMIDALGADLRGKVYDAVPERGTGNRREQRLRYKRFREPTVPSFDAAQVMNNIWYPQYAVAIDVPPEVFVEGDTPVSPVREKTREEEFAEMDSAKLLTYAERMKDLFPSISERAYAELARRGEAPKADTIKSPASKLDEALADLDEMSGELGKGREIPNTLPNPVGKPHAYDAREANGKVIAAAWPVPKETKRKGGAA